MSDPTTCATTRWLGRPGIAGVSSTRRYPSAMETFVVALREGLGSARATLDAPRRKMRSNAKARGGCAARRHEDLESNAQILGGDDTK